MGTPGSVRDPLLGRAAELADLQGALAEAAYGRGRLVLVVGPPGIGKTRLVEELAEHCPGQVGWGVAVSDEGMPPRWPWLRALRGTPAAVAALEATTPSASPQEAAAAQFATNAAVVAALEAGGADVPLLLVLEDLHWADPSTLGLLTHLAPELRRLPVLVVGTCREGSDGALSVALPALVSAPGMRLVRPAPLTARSSALLLEHSLRATGTEQQTDPEDLRSLARRAGGNPLLLRTLGRVIATGGPADLTAVPELRTLAETALTACPDSTREVLTVLATLGASADVAILAQISGLERTAVVAALPAAAAAGLLATGVPEASGHVAFTHALLRELVYAGIEPAQRAHWHERAAEALEPMAAVDPACAGQLARHLSRVGTATADGRSADWAVQAAGAARDVAAYAEAADLLAMAADALGRSGNRERRAEIMLDLARARFHTGELARSVQLCEQVCQDALDLQRPDLAAQAAVVVQGVADPDTSLAGIRMCRAALAALGPQGDPVLRSRLDAALACALLDVEDDSEVPELTATAIHLAAQSGDPDAEVDALRARAALLDRPGDAPERLTLGARAVELATRTGRPLAELWGRSWRIDAAMHLGSPGVAATEVLALAGLAERSGLPLVHWHVLRQQASAAALVGDFDLARTRSQQALAMAHRMQDTSAAGMHQAFLVTLALQRGTAEDLAANWRPALAAAPPIPVVVACRAAALLVAGERDAAHDTYLSVRPDPGENPWRHRRLAAIRYVTALVIAFQDAPAAAWLAQRFQELAVDGPYGGSGTVAWCGALARLAGELELTAGRPEQAVTLLELGVAQDARLGAAPLVAEGRLGLARALVARGAPGDRGRAADLARAAASDARRLDLPGPLVAADVLLAELARAAQVQDPLSPREREVAELVAQALTNREIATRLYLSERTVESHVRSALAKTGCSDRTALALWVRR